VSGERVERVLRAYELFNGGELENALEDFADEAEWLVLDQLPDPGPFRGPEGVRRFWEMWRESFPDFEAEVQKTIDLGDHVAVTIQVRGRGRDSGIEVRTPSFVQLWTWRGDAVVKVEMLPDEEAAEEAARS
jgi:ketosteroid isomerase-like protein